jgi:serine/threonine protein kinase
MKHKYVKVRKLGEGTYGTVHEAKNIETGQSVAIKKIKFDEEDEGIPTTALREIAILKRLNHVNVVKLLEVFYEAEEKKLYLVFEFVEEDLHRHCKSRRLSPLQIKSYAFQLLKAVEYLHANMVMHRDLKPQNVLVTAGGVLKVADFGLSRMFQLPFGTLSSEIETLWYRAPELLLGAPRYSLPVDMWSLGCIIYEIGEGEPMFESDSEVDLLNRIFQLYGTPSPEAWPALAAMPHFRANFPRFRPRPRDSLRTDPQGLDLIAGLTALDPERRLTVRKALQHPFFEGIHLPFY